MSDLSQELSRLRRLRGKTLRAVEEETGVSNAYLSQLETGSVMRPRPHILHKLAGFYKVPYEDLMASAGYLSPNDEKSPEDPDLVEIQLMSAGLSNRQKRELKRFIRFLQQSKEED